MKKISMILVALFGLVLFVSTTGCDKYDEATAVKFDQTVNTTTIQGVVYAELDNEEADYEFAPAGTKILVKIAYDDLLELGGGGMEVLKEMGGGAELGYWYAYTTVGSDGSYSVTVPATVDGVYVELVPEMFQEYVKDFEGNEEDDITTFYADSYEIYAYTSLKKYQDIYYYEGGED